MASSGSLKNVLITGGGGFLGSHIVRQLRKDEPVCTIYSASRNPKSHPDQEPGVFYETVDIVNEEQVAALFERVQPQVVMHTTSPHPLAPLRIQEQVNIQGTKNILKYAAACAGTLALIFTGSDSGMWPNQDPITEEQSRPYKAGDPARPYGITKAIADSLVLAANGPNLRTLSLRVPGMYGDHDYNGTLPALLKAVRNGEQKMQVGDNKKLFEVLDVRKAAEAHVLAAKAVIQPEAGAIAGGVFFISDGRAIPYWDFFRKCYAAAGAPVKPEEVKVIPLAVMQIMASAVEWAYSIFTLGYKQPELRRQNMDHFARGCNWSLDKAKKHLGYRPLTEVEQDASIKKMMEWGLVNLNKQ